MVWEEYPANALNHQKDEQVDPGANMPGTLLEAEITELKLSCFVHTRGRLGSSKKAIIRRNMEGKDNKQEKRKNAYEMG